MSVTENTDFRTAYLNPVVLETSYICFLRYTRHRGRAPDVLACKASLLGGITSFYIFQNKSFNEKILWSDLSFLILKGSDSEDSIADYDSMEQDKTCDEPNEPGEHSSESFKYITDYDEKRLH